MLSRRNILARSFGPTGRPRRPGWGLVEVIVVIGLLGFFAILVLVALPRGRESARFAGCRRNLMQIGVGLQMYHQFAGHYPMVPELGPLGGDGPVKAMLEALVIPDLLELQDPSKPPKPTRSPARGGWVPGLACPSDPNAMANRATPTVSYRANTGDDPGGLGGPFQPGRASTSAEVEAADGLGFTASFSERLTGDRRDHRPAPWNHAISPGEVPRGGCPDLPADRWRGDAGSDWSEASWRSTLYGHALPPNAGPSCIAEDGRTAMMGASSGHVDRVNVLLLDGSIRVVKPSIDPRVWAGLGTVGRPAP